MLTDPGVRDGPFLFLSLVLVDRPRERFLSWLVVWFFSPAEWVVSSSSLSLPGQGTCGGLFLPL